MKKAISRFAVLLFGIFILVLNVRLHRPGNVPVVLAQLEYLEDALAKGADEKMQSYFPEGYVFTWALYGLASAQVVQQFEFNDPRRSHHLAESWRAWEAIQSPEGKSTFVQEMSPEWGTFYAAWSLYLLAEYVRAAGPETVDASVLERFTRDADAFAQALEGHETPFLASYPDAAWPADTSVGIAALGIYNSTIAPRYEQVIDNWVLKAKRLLNPELGALSHAADATTGTPTGGVRGGSLALMSRVLVEADPDFARDQYAILRSHFVDYRLGLPGVREYPHGVRGNGDIDFRSGHFGVCRTRCSGGCSGSES